MEDGNKLEFIHLEKKKEKKKKRRLGSFYLFMNKSNQEIQFCNFWLQEQ